MIEKYISSLLVPYFSQFVENINPDQFCVDLWGGKASLNDLVLKPNVLETLLGGESNAAGANSSASFSAPSVATAAAAPQSSSSATTTTTTTTISTTTTTGQSATKCVSSSTTTTGTSLPVILQRGICKRVNIVVPFTQLRSKPVVVEIDELFICVRRNTQGNDEVLSKAARLDAQAAQKARELEQFEEERRRMRDTAAALKEGSNTTNTAGAKPSDGRNTSSSDTSADNGGFSVFSLFSSGSTGGYFSRIGELVINNIVVNIRSVHVRYEDESTRSVIGAILAGVQLLTVDSATGEAKFVDSSGQKRLLKRLVFDGLQLYCDDPVRYDMSSSNYFLSNIKGISEWIEAMRLRISNESVTLSTILGPVKGSLDLSLVFKDFVMSLLHEPYLLLQLNLGSVVARLNHAQYLSLIKTISLLSNWGKVNNILPCRPNVPIKQHAAVWWRYAIRAVRAIAGASRRERLLQRISEVCIVDYHVLYRDVVRKTEMSAEKRRNYRFITRFMTVPDMIAGRRYVYTQIANAIQLKRKDGEARKAEAQLLGLDKENKKKKGFFSWFRRGSATQDQAQEDELAFEELERLYGIDPNNSEEKEKDVVSVSNLPQSYCWLDFHFDFSLLCIHVELTKSEAVTLMLRSVGAEFKKFNAPNSVKLMFVANDLTLSNPLQDKALLKRMPFLIERASWLIEDSSITDKQNVEVSLQEGNYSKGGSDVSLLQCSATFNPVTAHEPQSLKETNLDFTLDLRVLPIRIVADPPTIDTIIRFFEIPKGLDLSSIISSTRQLASSMGQAASTELSRAMAHSKSFSISVDVAAPLIIFPKTLLGSIDEPALAVSLGRVKFDTQPLSEVERQNRLANKLTTDMTQEDEEKLFYYSSAATFSDFYVELASIAMTLERPGKGFMLVPEIAFSAEVLQLIDGMKHNCERFIVRVDVPALRVACSVSQAYILSDMVESWLLYLEANASKYDNEQITPPFERSILNNDKTTHVGISGSGIDAQNNTLRQSSTVLLHNKKGVDQELEDPHLSSTCLLGKTREDLPYLRLHVTVKELGVVIFEDDPETLKPMNTARFTLAFSTAALTLHMRTLQRHVKMVFGKFFCRDIKDPNNLIINGAMIHCNFNIAPGAPVEVVVELEPSLMFRCGTPCIQLLETLMDIINLMIPLPTTGVIKSSPVLRGIAGSDSESLNVGYFYSMFNNEPQSKLTEKSGTSHLDTPVVHLSLHIAGAATVELMDRRKKSSLLSKIGQVEEGKQLQEQEQHYETEKIKDNDKKEDEEEEEDYSFAYVSFTEISLLLKKNLLTFEVSGGVQQVTFALSETHDIAPENRTIVQYKAPLMLTPRHFSTHTQPRGDDDDSFFGIDRYARQESHEHVNFAYRTSLPVVPMFYTDSSGKRQLSNASDLRFSAFVEIELRSSTVLFDAYSIMTITQYFSSGFFANVVKLTSRPRYDGRAMPLRPKTLSPSLLTSVRVYARDLLFSLPIDARKCDSNYFYVNVNHVVAQSSLLAVEGQQTMNISLCEIRLFCDGPLKTDKAEENRDQQEQVLPHNALMPTTTLDVSLKSSLDPLSDEPLQVDLRGDDVTLAITEADVVELCKLISGNLTRFPPSPSLSSSVLLPKQEEPKLPLSHVPAKLFTTDVPGASLLSTEQSSGAGVVASLSSNAATAGAGGESAVLTKKEKKASYEVRVTWRANKVCVRFLDDTRENAFFRLEGNSFVFHVVMPCNDVSVRWESLELHDVYEETKRATMMFCDSGSIELRNILTTRSSLEKRLVLPQKAFLTAEGTTTIPDLADVELPEPEVLSAINNLEVLEIPTLVVDFTLKRFAISDQWLAVYDFVWNEAVMEALKPIMTRETTETKTPVKENLHQSLSLSQQSPKTSSNLLVQESLDDNTAAKKPFCFQLKTRSVNVPFLTISREEFIEADIKSLFIDTISLSNTTNITIRIAELAVRHCSSGEYILYKQHDLIDQHMSQEETLPLADPNIMTYLHNSVLVDSDKTVQEKTASDNILTICGFFDTVMKQQKMRIALGQLSALCSVPLLMQIVDYCTGIDQPIAKISNLGVMREQRKWLERAAKSMVKNDTFCLDLLWRQPRIVFAGDGLELSNKSRNIEAQLGVMHSRMFLDKSKDSCLVKMKLTDFAISEVLEKFTLQLSYVLKEKLANMTIVVDKVVAFFHPAEVEKLLWIFQRNFMVPVVRNNAVMNKADEISQLTLSQQEAVLSKTKEEKEHEEVNTKEEENEKEGKEEEQTEINEKEKGEMEELEVKENEKLAETNDVSLLKVEVHAKGIELALYDVVSINAHTLFIGECDAEIKSNGDAQMSIHSFKMVEHFTNRELLSSLGQKTLTLRFLSAEKTTYMTLMDIRLLLIPKAIGTLFNMLLSIQFPPPLQQQQQQLGDVLAMRSTFDAQEASDMCQDVSNDNNTSNTNVFSASNYFPTIINKNDVIPLNSVAILKQRLQLSLNCCRIDATHGGHDVFSANVENTVLDWRTYTDESSAFTVSIEWVTVRDDFFSETRYPEIVRPLLLRRDEIATEINNEKVGIEGDQEEGAQRLPVAVEFSFYSLPHKNNNLMITKTVDGNDDNNDNEHLVTTALSYVYELRGYISSFQVVLVPELTSAISTVLSEVKDYISDVNCEKAYNYVADKAAQAVQRRKDLTLVEVTLHSPSIILVDVPTSLNTVELFPGDVVVRNKLCSSKGDDDYTVSPYNCNAEMFYLYVNRVSLSIIGESAFCHKGKIEINFLRIITNSVNSSIEDTSNTGDITLSLTIPILSAKMTQKQLSYLFDVIGAFRFMDSTGILTEGAAHFASSASQAPSCGHQEGAASAASIATPISGSIPNPIITKKKGTFLELIPQQHHCGNNSNNNNNTSNTSNSNNNINSGNNNVNSIIPLSSNDMPFASTLQCNNNSGGTFFFRATMRRLEAQIGDLFRLGVDQLSITHSSNSCNNTSKTNITLDTVFLQHCLINSTNPGVGFFLMKKADVILSSSVTRDGTSCILHGETEVELDCLQMTFTPLMLTDTYEVLYGPFCKKVLRVPFTPTIVCKITTGIHVLDSDLVLDNYRILTVVNDTRCSYKLDLNQHRLFLSGFPGPQIILGDNCHLTILNGIIVISGMYSLSSFVSFGLNAAIFTTDTCMIEKKPYIDPIHFHALRQTHKRSKSCAIDNSNASQMRRSASFSMLHTGSPSQPTALLSCSNSGTTLQQQNTFTGAQSTSLGNLLTTEETQVVFSLKCPEFRLSIASDVVRGIDVALKTSLSFFYTHNADNKAMLNRSFVLRLTDVQTCGEGETKLLPTSLELIFSGVDVVRVSISLNSIEFCLRAYFLCFLIELGNKFLKAFTGEIPNQWLPSQVTFENNDFMPLVTVKDAGECFYCGSKNAFIGESINEPGVLCRFCCTGRSVPPATDFNFSVPFVDIVFLSGNGGMLQISSTTGVFMSIDSANMVEVQLKLSIRNFNYYAAVWEPLVELFEGSLTLDRSLSRYVLNVSRFDYIFSQDNVKFLLQFAEEFSSSSLFQQKLSKKFSSKQLSDLHSGSNRIHETSSEEFSQMLLATETYDDNDNYKNNDIDDLLWFSNVCEKNINNENDYIYIFVVVMNYCHVPYEIDGKRVEPYGKCLEFETKSRCGLLRGVGGDSDNVIAIDWIRSPLYISSNDILIEINIEMSLDKNSYFVQHIVHVNCYPVHKNNMIIYIKNNINMKVEILSGLPVVEPGEKFYFHPKFLLDEKLQIRPILVDKNEEYDLALTKKKLLTPTLRMLLNRSFTNLVCKSRKNSQNVFFMRMKEQQECVRAGIPVFFISIEPQVCICNYLPHRVFVSIRSSRLKEAQIHDSFLEGGESTNVVLGEFHFDELLVYFEVYQQNTWNDDNPTYRMRGEGVVLSFRDECVKLYGGSKGKAVMRLLLKRVDDMITITTPYTIANLTPLDLYVWISKKSGEALTKAKTNFNILPKNMQLPCAASPKDCYTNDFFVNISTGSNMNAYAVPLHIQGRGVITLEEWPSVGSSREENARAFHLIYLTQFDMNGIRSVTIVPRWVLVNRTPRPLYLMQALRKTSSVFSKIGTSGSCGDGCDSQPASSTTTSFGLPCGEKDEYIYDNDLAQLVPAHSSTPFMAIRVCNDTTGYGAFLLSEKNACVFGNPVNLEEIGNTLLVAYGQHDTRGVNKTDVFVDTSVVIDGPYTFVIFQEPAVSPYVVLNRTGISLELHEISGRFLTRVMPGCIEELVLDIRGRNSRTRIYFSRDVLCEPNLDIAVNTINMNTNDDLCYDYFSTDGGKVQDSSIAYAEFNFNEPMTQKDALNLLGITYNVSLGPYGQQIIEIIPSSYNVRNSKRVYQLPPPLSLNITLQFAVISVSVVGRNTDIFFGALLNTYVQFSRQGLKEFVTFSVGNLQVDNQSEAKPTFEVLLFPLKPTPESSSISGFLERTYVPARSLLYIDDIRLDIVPIVLRISDNVLVAVLSLVREITAHSPQRQAALTDQELYEKAPLTIGIMNTHVIIDSMMINPFVLRLWFSRDFDGNDFIRGQLPINIASFVSFLVHSCEDVNISIPGVVARKRSSTAALMLQWVMKVYFEGVRNGFYGILFQYVSSLPLIGAPIKLVSGFGTGALKFFQKPIVNLSTSSKDFALGLASRSTALVTDVVSGGLDAVSNLAKTGAGLISVASGERRGKKTNFFRGIASGVTGVVTKPMEGAAESGAVGLVRGVGLGLLGVVAGPVAGLLSDVSKVTGTAARLCDDSHIPKRKRMRKLRDFYAAGAVAEYQSLLSVFEYERGEPGVSQWKSDPLLPCDGPDWYPKTKEEIQLKNALPPDIWKLDLYDTNFEGWKFCSRYYGIYTRMQEKSARVRRRRWVAMLKAPHESRIVLVMQQETNAIANIYHATSGGGGFAKSSDDDSRGNLITGGGSGNNDGTKTDKIVTQGGGAVMSTTQQKQELRLSLSHSKLLQGATTATGEEKPRQREQEEETSPSSQKSPHFLVSSLSSNSVGVVELYEYEFKVPLIGWSSRFLPAGYSQWQYSDGRAAPRKSDYELPSGLVWSSDWTLSGTGGKAGAKEASWEYIQKDNDFSSPATLRRRCWRRAYKKNTK